MTDVQMQTSYGQAQISSSALTTDRYFNAVYEACVNGVHSGFKHLSIEQIKEPPKGWFDALLARQIVLHMMVNQFDIPRRRIVKELSRNRGQVRSSIYVVGWRMEHPDFLKAYSAMTKAAEDYLMSKSEVA